MFFFCFTFVCLLAVVGCQYSASDQILKNTLSIEVDKECVRSKIGANNYDHLRFDLRDCVMDYFLQFNSEYVKGSMDNRITAFCEDDKSSLCSALVKEKLEVCLNDSQKNHLTHTTDAMLATKMYACADGAKKFKEIQNVDKSKCSDDELQSKVQKCQEMSFPLKRIKLDDLYKKEACQDLEKYWQCSADVWSCAGETVYKFNLEKSLAGLKATPCREFVSASSSISILNSVLVLMISTCTYLEKLLS